MKENEKMVMGLLSETMWSKNTVTIKHLKVMKEKEVKKNLQPEKNSRTVVFLIQTKKDKLSVKI